MATCACWQGVQHCTDEAVLLMVFDVFHCKGDNQAFQSFKVQQVSADLEHSLQFVVMCMVLHTLFG